MFAINKITEAMRLYQKGHDHIQTADRILSSGPANFYFKNVEGYVDALFNRFAPFKVGDRVKIIKAPKCKGGWAHYKHFLVKGAIGTVHEVDYYDDHFCADVEWDNETWMDGGIEKPVSCKHTFRMWENQIKTVRNEK